MPARIASLRPFVGVALTLMFVIAIDGDAAAASSFVDANGQIRGCIDRTGRLTVLKKSRKKCKRGQRLLVWSQQGPPGGVGANGNEGAPGPKGDTGPADGPAGGDLTGTFPNPTLAPGVVGLGNLTPGLAALLPSADQVAALAGTSGAPGAANRFVTDADSRLTNSRTPSGTASGDLTGTYPGPTLAANSIDSTGLFTSSLKDGTAGTATLRSLGTTGSTAAAGNDARFPASGEKSALAGTNGTPGNANRYVTDSDSRLTNSRAPSGTAGGDLAGTYPNPTLGTLPHIRTRQTAAQSFPANGSFIRVTLDQATDSSGATFDNANDEVDISRSGFYLITGEIVWTTNASGVRFLSVNANGIGELLADSRTGVSGIETVQTVVGLAHLDPGNSVSLIAGQSSGASLTTTVFNGRSAQLSLQWVGN